MRSSSGLIIKSLDPDPKGAPHHFGMAISIYLALSVSTADGMI